MPTEKPLSGKRAGPRTGEKRGSRIIALLQQQVTLWVSILTALGAVIAYLGRHRREAAIMETFIENDAVAQVGVAALVGVIGVLFVIRSRHPLSAWWPGLSLGSRGFLRGIPLLVLTLVGWGAFLAALRVRYAVFSETWFQDRAIAEASEGKMVDATRTCSRYLQLYPQRRPGQRLADPICNQILGDFRNVRRLADYIRQSHSPNLSRPLRDTTFAFSTRNEARRLLEWTRGVTPQPWWTHPDSIHRGAPHPAADEP